MSRFFNYMVSLTAAIGLVSAHWSIAQTYRISGKVTDASGTAISGALVKLEKAGQSVTTGSDGSFILANGSAGLGGNSFQASQPALAFFGNGHLNVRISEKSAVVVTAFDLRGTPQYEKEYVPGAGTHSLPISAGAPGLLFYRVKAGNNTIILKSCSIEGNIQGTTGSPFTSTSSGVLAKKTEASASFQDVLLITKSGYLTYSLTLTNADTNGLQIKLAKNELAKFSFFVTSLKALQKLSGSEKGFGGDLRFGETGPGAGLRGADKICATIAEQSMAGSADKGWRAFLSATADENGEQVNAVDRIGEGPWYDRLGRLLAPPLEDLVNTRPENGDPTIKNDLPNEDGVPNHRPDPTQPEVDNHHFITGSTTDGKLYSKSATCKDWTVADGSSEYGKPRCGLSWPRGGGSRPGGRSSKGSHWISSISGAGCAAGVELEQRGGAKPGEDYIGAGGGYGGFYCFALNP
jgi:hypothetical protein